MNGLLSARRPCGVKRPAERGNCGLPARRPIDAERRTSPAAGYPFVFLLLSCAVQYNGPPPWLSSPRPAAGGRRALMF